MDTSLPCDFGRSLLIGCMAMLTGCAEASSCSSINDSFGIYHWHGTLPKSVQVYIMKRGTDQQIRAAMTYWPSLSHSYANRVGDILTLRPKTPANPDLSASDDYRIVIDDHLEYLVHDIVMEDRAELGCPIKSATVNTCKRGPDMFVNMESECGRQLP